MNENDEYYVDTMPCDETLLKELGRVHWAAARLHFTMRDTLNLLEVEISDDPFKDTLGKTRRTLEERARSVSADKVAEWATGTGRDAIDARNVIAHAVTYTAPDGRQALMTTRERGYERIDRTRLRETTHRLVKAAIALWDARRAILAEEADQTDETS